MLEKDAEVAHLNLSLECAPCRWIRKTVVIAPKKLLSQALPWLLE